MSYLCNDKQAEAMGKIICMMVALAVSKCLTAAEADTLSLCLQDAIRLARSQSPSVQSARNTFLAAYWNYRYFRAN